MSLYLAGCATLSPPKYGTGLPQQLPARVDLVDVPFHPQDRYQCSPEALATVLGSAGAAKRAVDICGPRMEHYASTLATVAAKVIR